MAGVYYNQVFNQYYLENGPLEPYRVVNSIEYLNGKVEGFDGYEGFVGMVFFDKSDNCLKVATSVNSSAEVDNWEYVSVSDMVLAKIISEAKNSTYSLESFDVDGCAEYIKNGHNESVYGLSESDVVKRDTQFLFNGGPAEVMRCVESESYLEDEYEGFWEGMIFFDEGEKKLKQIASIDEQGLITSYKTISVSEGELRSFILNEIGSYIVYVESLEITNARAIKDALESTNGLAFVGQEFDIEYIIGPEKVTLAQNFDWSVYEGKYNDQTQVDKPELKNCFQFISTDKSHGKLKIVKGCNNTSKVLGFRLDSLDCSTEASVFDTIDHLCKITENVDSLTELNPEEISIETNKTQPTKTIYYQIQDINDSFDVVPYSTNLDYDKSKFETCTLEFDGTRGDEGQLVLTFTPKADTYGSTKITVTVTNFDGNSISKTKTVNLTKHIDATSITLKPEKFTLQNGVERMVYWSVNPTDGTDRDVSTFVFSDHGSNFNYSFEQSVEDKDGSLNITFDRTLSDFKYIDGYASTQLTLTAKDNESIKASYKIRLGEKIDELVVDDITKEYRPDFFEGEVVDVVDVNVRTKDVSCAIEKEGSFNVEVLPNEDGTLSAVTVLSQTGVSEGTLDRRSDTKLIRNIKLQVVRHGSARIRVSALNTDSNTPIATTFTFTANEKIGVTDVYLSNAPTPFVLQYNKPRTFTYVVEPDRASVKDVYVEFDKHDTSISKVKNTSTSTVQLTSVINSSSKDFNPRDVSALMSVASVDNLDASSKYYVYYGSQVDSFVPISPMNKTYEEDEFGHKTEIVYIDTNVYNAIEREGSFSVWVEQDDDVIAVPSTGIEYYGKMSEGDEDFWNRVDDDKATFKKIVLPLGTKPGEATIHYEAYNTDSETPIIGSFKFVSNLNVHPVTSVYLSDPESENGEQVTKLTLQNGIQRSFVCGVRPNDATYKNVSINFSDFSDYFKSENNKFIQNSDKLKDGSLYLQYTAPTDGTQKDGSTMLTVASEADSSKTAVCDVYFGERITSLTAEDQVVSYPSSEFDGTKTVTFYIEADDYAIEREGTFRVWKENEDASDVIRDISYGGKMSDGAVKVDFGSQNIKNIQKVVLTLGTEPGTATIKFAAKNTGSDTEIVGRCSFQSKVSAPSNVNIVYAASNSRVNGLSLRYNEEVSLSALVPEGTDDSVTWSSVKANNENDGSTLIIGNKSGNTTTITAKTQDDTATAKTKLIVKSNADNTVTDEIDVYVYPQLQNIEFCDNTFATADGSTLLTAGFGTQNVVFKTIPSNAKVAIEDVSVHTPGLTEFPNVDFVRDDDGNIIIEEYGNFKGYYKLTLKENTDVLTHEDLHFQLGINAIIGSNESENFQFNFVLRPKVEVSDFSLPFGFNMNKVGMRKNQVLTFTPTYSPDDADNVEFTWSTQEPEILNVRPKSKDASISSLKDGSAGVKAEYTKLNNTKLTKYLSVYVSEPIAESNFKLLSEANANSNDANIRAFKQIDVNGPSTRQIFVALPKRIDEQGSVTANDIDVQITSPNNVLNFDTDFGVRDVEVADSSYSFYQFNLKQTIGVSGDATLTVSVPNKLAWPNERVGEFKDGSLGFTNISPTVTKTLEIKVGGTSNDNDSSVTSIALFDANNLVKDLGDNTYETYLQFGQQLPLNVKVLPFEIAPQDVSALIEDDSSILGWTPSGSGYIVSVKSNYNNGSTLCPKLNVYSKTKNDVSVNLNVNIGAAVSGITFDPLQVVGGNNTIIGGKGIFQNGTDSKTITFEVSPSNALIAPGAIELRNSNPSLVSAILDSTEDGTKCIKLKKIGHLVGSGTREDVEIKVVVYNGWNGVTGEAFEKPLNVSVNASQFDILEVQNEIKLDEFDIIQTDSDSSDADTVVGNGTGSSGSGSGQHTLTLKDFFYTDDLPANHIGGDYERNTGKLQFTQVSRDF